MDVESFPTRVGNVTQVDAIVNTSHLEFFYRVNTAVSDFLRSDASLQFQKHPLAVTMICYPYDGWTCNTVSRRSPRSLTTKPSAVLAALVEKIFSSMRFFGIGFGPAQTHSSSSAIADP